MQSLPHRLGGNLAHLLVCPALAAEQESLIRVTLEKLKDWAQETIETLETRTCRKLVQESQRVLRKSIASDRLTILAHDFWKASCKKEVISSRCFIASVRKVLARADCKCERNNDITCNSRQCYPVPLSLLQLLVHRLCLHVLKQERMVSTTLLCSITGTRRRSLTWRLEQKGR